MLIYHTVLQVRIDFSMSGIEVAAIILGVIPVVLEAFDRSGKLFEPYRKHRRYVKDIQKLEYQLRTEMAIFSGHCVILLYAITGNRDRARNLFEARTENTFIENTLADGSFERLKHYLHDSLNTSLVACRETITQLQHSLDSLNDVILSLKAANLPSLTVKILIWTGSLDCHC